jgi:hypothetical protein
MYPSITFSDQKAPGKGWQCVCREVNCSHASACSQCGTARYALEKAGQLINGRIVEKIAPLGGE